MNLRLIFFAFLLTTVSTIGICQDADVLKSDAIRFEMDQDFHKSASLYEQAASLYEQNGVIDTMCFFRAGQNYVRIKEFSKAIPLLQKVVALKGEGEEPWLSLAEALSGVNKYDEAQDLLDRGAAEFPDKAFLFWRKKTELAYAAKRNEAALSYVNEALKYEDATDLLLLKAHVLDLLGKTPLAVEVYRKILKKDPDNLGVQQKLGFLIFKATDSAYKAEKNRYNKLSNPTRVDYSNSRKRLEQIAQRYKEAIPYLEKVLSGKPEDQNVMKCLYVCYSRLGNKTKEAELKQKLGL